MEIPEIKKPAGLAQPVGNNLNQPAVPTGAMPIPVNKEWGKGDLKIGDDGVFYTPPGSDTVEGRLGGLLERGSPYIEAAKAGAQRQANSRGLLNSTMAATAGEKAGIESALPIAQQDAGYFQQRGLNTQQGEIQKGLYETQGDISERLAAAGYTHETAMKEADMAWNQTDLSARMDIERERLTQQNKEKFNELSNKISDDYMKDYMELVLNPNFKSGADRQRAIDVLLANTKRRFEIAGVVSSVVLDWGGSELPVDIVPPTPAPVKNKRKEYNQTPVPSWASEYDRWGEGMP